MVAQAKDGSWSHSHSKREKMGGAKTSLSKEIYRLGFVQTFHSSIAILFYAVHLFFPVPLYKYSFFFYYFYYFFLFLFLSFFFLGLHPWRMEVPRLGVESEPLLPAYATAIQDPSHICNLHRSSEQHGILIHWAILTPGIEPASSWILVRFVTTEPWGELPCYSSFNHHHPHHHHLHCAYNSKYFSKYISYLFNAHNSTRVGTIVLILLRAKWSPRACR